MKMSKSCLNIITTQRKHKTFLLEKEMLKKNNLSLDSVEKQMRTLRPNTRSSLNDSHDGIYSYR